MDYKYEPKTKTALIAAIRSEIKLHGNYADLNCIDTSAITNMRELFNKFKSFDGDVSGWDVSNVTDMTDMFRESSFRGDISSWNVDKVEYFFPMFVYCRIPEDHKPARFRLDRPVDAPLLTGKLNWQDISFTLSGEGACTVYGDLSGDFQHDFSGVDCYKLPVKHLVIAEGVTEIGSYAFSEWRNIEELTLPSSLVKIGRAAFHRCNEIKAIHFSEGLQVIESCAFGSCQVGELHLPETLTTIGAGAFSYFGQLVELNLPDSIVSINSEAFSHCSSLQSVKLPAGLKVISKSMFSHCDALKHVQMPAELEKIESDAFYDCPELKTVDLPDTVNDVSCDAFESCEFQEGGLDYCVTNYITAFNNCTVSADDYVGDLEIPSFVYHDGRTFVVNGIDRFSCKKMTRVRIPDTISDIPVDAFEGCSALRTIEIPSSVTTIGAEAFAECCSLRSIEIPDSVTEIADNLFDGCWRLREVHLGTNTTTIGEYAFHNCEFLQHLDIPDSVHLIGSYAFKGCKNLVDLHMPKSLTCLSLYALEGTPIMMQDGPIYSGHVFCGYGGSIPKHTCLEIREGTTLIAEAALRERGGLESVILPESLEIIGYEAFNDCGNLEHVYIPSSLKELGCESFDWTPIKEVEVPWKQPECSIMDSFPEEAVVYVPVGASEAYKSDKDWGKYKIVEKENCASYPPSFVNEGTVIVGRRETFRVILVEKPPRKFPWNLYGVIVSSDSDIDPRRFIKDLLFESFRDTARYLDLTDWSGDKFDISEELEYGKQRFAVVDMPDGASPQTQMFDGRTYLTDETFYNSLTAGGVQWEPLEEN